MEGLFVWILLFAGVTLTFLGVLLIASERELKTKRREVEALLSKLEGVSGGDTSSPSAAEADHSAELNQLRASNRELQNQIAGLSDQLDRSRKAIGELEASQQTNPADTVEFRQLREANHDLQNELAEMRARLAATETSSSAAHDATQSNAQAQAEIAALQEKLNESQAQIRELEAAQHNIPNIEQIEQKHREQRQTFDAEIAELNKKLSASQEKLSELDALRTRLADSEREQENLRDQTLRHEQQISRWQGQLAEAEVHRQKLAALQTPFNALLSKQALLAEKQRELQADLEQIAGLVEKGSPQNPTAASAGSLPIPSGESMISRTTEHNGVFQPEGHEEAAVQAEPNKKRWFGMS
jgi:DNA repair exonuclease SbcCD ATPase subunit